MISAAAFADASKHVSLNDTPYAPVGKGGSRSSTRQRRRRFRAAVISGRALAAVGSYR